MVYRRTGLGRRRSRRRRVARGPSNYQSAMKLANTAYRGVRYLKGLVNSEKFMHEIDLINTEIVVAGSLVHLSGIANGDTESTRTGNSIFIKSLYFRIGMELAAADLTSFVRIILFIDKQQIADTAPTKADLIQANSGAVVSVFEPLNELTKGRFTILRDTMVTLDTAKGLTAFRNYYIKLNHHVRFNGTASTDVQKGGIYALVFSDKATTAAPFVTWSSRISYHDN